MFSYDKLTNSTPQKREQTQLARVSNSIERKLLSKVLDFIERI